MAPYCAIPRDYLSDTPLLRAMGFLVSQHGQLGAIPPTPFLSDSPFESMRSGGAIPPLKRGISAIHARYPMEKGKWVRYPPLRYCLERVLHDIGGFPHWAAKDGSRNAIRLSIPAVSFKMLSPTFWNDPPVAVTVLLVPPHGFALSYCCRNEELRVTVPLPL